MTNDYLAALAPKLTINGAINLKSSIDHPSPHNPDSICGSGGIFTGMGKYTTLAAIGVINSLVKLGLAELRGEFDLPYITPLGREMAIYIHQNWDDLVTTFRDPPRRGY